ncbi:uncharacterized protein LOC143026744 [Oratosquilla oratoria]|uniref:uncharacterized protein LOC143026744 n=1 Tax=Oratosquilla oratoria TaxID=337810 RepID=UPI003F75D283
MFTTLSTCGYQYDHLTTSHVSTAGGEQIVISDASQPPHTRSSNSRGLPIAEHFFFFFAASHVSTAGGEQIVISDASQPTHTRSSNSRASHVSTAGGEQIVISDASQPPHTRSSNSRASRVSTAGGEQIVISESWLPIHNIFDAKEHPEDSSRRDPTLEEEGIILRKRKFLDTCEMTHTAFLHDTIHALKQQLAVVHMERDNFLIENRKYQELITILQGNIKSDIATVTSDIKEKLRAHFSDTQIKSLLEGKHNVAKWSDEDLRETPKDTKEPLISTLALIKKPNPMRTPTLKPLEAKEPERNSAPLNESDNKGNSSSPKKEPIASKRTSSSGEPRRKSLLPKRTPEYKRTSNLLKKSDTKDIQKNPDPKDPCPLKEPLVSKNLWP